MLIEPKLQPFQVEFRTQDDQVIRKEFMMLTPDRTLVITLPEGSTLEALQGMVDQFVRIMENLPPVIFMTPGCDLKVLTIKGE